MGRPREFDTTQAIEDISEEFWAHGFESTGISDLEGATGLARARLYGVFGSKRQMLHRAIDFYLDERIERIFLKVDKGGLEGVSNFFRRFAQVVEMRPERSAMGCLMVNSIVEFGKSDPGVNERANRYRERVRGAFRSALQTAAEAGEIEGDIDGRADLAYMMLMGLYISVKGGASIPEIRRLCTVVIDAVESWRRRG